MTSILCLAHYCDLHGPTPLMCTEGLPLPCSTCYNHEPPSYVGGDRKHSTSSTPTTSMSTSATIAEALRRLDLETTRSSSVPASGQELPINRAALRRNARVNSSSTAVETPPISPRYPPDSAHMPGPHQPRRGESSYRRTYDESTTKRAGPCDNCALTLPRLQENGSKGNVAEPERILRSHQPFRVSGGGQSGDAQPLTSTSTDTDDDDEPRRAPTHHRSGTVTSTTSGSSASSTSRTNGHTHWLEYTSTHEPVVPASFSLVRAACLRALSFETLPRGTASAASSPMASPSTPGFSLGAAASGGPIFFGDSSAGYTTAYIFRIPDVHARGHKRVYCFMALSTQRERLAMKTFGYLSEEFRELAAWIQNMAEAEAERYSNSSGANSPMSVGYGAPGYGMSQAQSQPIENTYAGGSGFLSGGMGSGLSRRMGGGYGGGGISLKARGLAELVGLPDFFLELHLRFVQLLAKLGYMLSS